MKPTSDLQFSTKETRHISFWPLFKNKNQHHQAHHNALETGFRSTLTSWCDDLKVVRLRSHHDLISNNGKAVHISLLSSAWVREILTKNLGSSPEFTWKNRIPPITCKKWSRSDFDCPGILNEVLYTVHCTVRLI